MEISKELNNMEDIVKYFYIYLFGFLMVEVKE